MSENNGVFSVTFLAGHLVLDLRADECDFHDVADAAGVDADVLERMPAFLEQGEAAFSLVAQAAEEEGETSCTEGSAHFP